MTAMLEPLPIVFLTAAVVFHPLLSDGPQAPVASKLTTNKYAMA